LACGQSGCYGAAGLGALFEKLDKITVVAGMCALLALLLRFFAFRAQRRQGFKWHCFICLQLSTPAACGMIEQLCGTTVSCGNILESGFLITWCRLLGVMLTQSGQWNKASAVLLRRLWKLHLLLLPGGWQLGSIRFLGAVTLASTYQWFERSVSGVFDHHGSAMAVVDFRQMSVRSDWLLAAFGILLSFIDSRYGGGSRIPALGKSAPLAGVVLFSLCWWVVRHFQWHINVNPNPSFQQMNARLDRRWLNARQKRGQDTVSAGSKTVDVFENEEKPPVRRRCRGRLQRCVFVKLPGHGIACARTSDLDRSPLRGVLTQPDALCTYFAWRTAGRQVVSWGTTRTLQPFQQLSTLPRRLMA